MLAFFFQHRSNGRERKPVESSKLMQSISPSDDLQQKLSQNSLETTSEITPLESELLYLPMYYQARLKLSLSPEHSLLFSLFHSSVCQDCILPIKHDWRHGQGRSFGIHIPTQATQAEMAFGKSTDLWLKNWLTWRRKKGSRKLWWGPLTILTDNAGTPWASPWMSHGLSESIKLLQ